MNQILSTDNSYRQKKSRNSSDLLDMRKVILVFSVLIIVFALVIVGAKVYGMIKENNKNKENNNPIAVLNKPMIDVKRIDNQCRIEIKYDDGLQKIAYWWNDGDKIEKNMHGATEPKITLEIPEGDYNTLYVEAIGVDGSKNEVKQEFAVEGAQDPDKPQIQWFYEEQKIKIIAKSDKGIKELTYKWEDGEQQTISSTEEGQKELMTTIDAKRGTNKIYITATDMEENTQEKSETIQGVFPPEVDLKIENPNILKINVKHDMGFKKVSITINGSEQIYDESSPQYSNNITEINVNIPVPSGRLDVKISVYTLEEPEKEYITEGWQEIPE